MLGQQDYALQVMLPNNVLGKKSFTFSIGKVEAQGARGSVVG
jgi:hypothetical protein